MKQMRSYAVRAMVMASAFTVLSSSAGAAQRYGVANAAVTVKCPMTVGGSFEAKTKALTGELALDAAAPGTVTGTISVDLSGIDTGIDLRNRHLREKYLEVDKAPDHAAATLSNIKLEGPGAAGLSGQMEFQGLFTLRGQARAVSGTATLTQAGDQVQVEASFPVHIPDYGIKKPRYMGVGVKDRVTVQVTFDAVPLPGDGQ